MLSNTAFSSFYSKTGCPDTYPHTYGDSFYYISDTKLSHNDADIDCAADGAHLVDITSAAEQAFVVEMLNTSHTGTHNNLFIGLLLDDDGERRWSDGTLLDYTAWPTNGAWDPDTDSSAGRTCHRIRRIYDYRWVDSSCEDLKHYVCECEGMP